MLILSLAVVLPRTTGDALILSQAFELSSFGYFKQNTVKEFAVFFTRTIAQRATTPGERFTVTTDDDTYKVHVYHPIRGPVCVAMCDNEYPPRVAFTLLSKISDEFNTTFGDAAMRASRDKEFELSTLPGTLTRYQDPNVDPMMRVQKDLDETKAVMVKTMENLIGRGEKLEHLMETSNDLSGQAKLFHKQAKKTNSCCVLS